MGRRERHQRRLQQKGKNMREENKNSEDKEVVETAVETVVEAETQEPAEKKAVTEEVEEVEEVEAVPKVDNSDIFITEKDRFVVDIEYYMAEKHNPIIKDFDEDIDKTKDLKKISITFKYPSQRDADAITLTRPIEDIENTTYNEFVQLENLRIIVLIREWTVDKSIEEIIHLHPKIIKAIRKKITEEIGGNGIY